MTRIACIGEAMIELSLQGATAQVGVAGDTLNTAVYLKRQAPSVEVDYFTRLGDDPFSDQIVDFISDQQLGIAAIERAAGQSPGLYAITTNAEGERSFTYWRDSSAARGMFADRDFSMLETYDAIYLSGISLAILPHTVRCALIDWLRSSKVTLIYDSNFRPRLWESEDRARAITSALWERADIALPSIDDEMALFAQTQAEVTTRVRGINNGALKRGAAGPLSLGRATEQTYPPAPKVVDTTAAGDSFNGAYLGALFTGASQAEALMAGHLCAVEVVQHRGAIIPV